jgi:hypothetical protein
VSMQLANVSLPVFFYRNDQTWNFLV